PHTSTPSLHDALPIFIRGREVLRSGGGYAGEHRHGQCHGPDSRGRHPAASTTQRGHGGYPSHGRSVTSVLRSARIPASFFRWLRSEEHTSELQSPDHL